MTAVICSRDSAPAVENDMVLEAVEYSHLESI